MHYGIAIRNPRCRDTLDRFKIWRDQKRGISLYSPLGIVISMSSQAITKQSMFWKIFKPPNTLRTSHFPYSPQILNLKSQNTFYSHFPHKLAIKSFPFSLQYLFPFWFLSCLSSFTSFPLLLLGEHGASWNQTTLTLPSTGFKYFFPYFLTFVLVYTSFIFYFYYYFYFCFYYF